MPKLKQGWNCADCWRGLCSMFDQPWFWYGIWFYTITGLGTLATWLAMYNYDMFISVYGLNSLDILWVQSVFAVWNVINDLLAGYVSDWFQHKCGGRLLLLVPCNLMWCLATVIPYYDVGGWLGIPYSVHYLLYIGLNDAFVATCSIVSSAVWVDDLTNNENERLKLTLVTKPIGFAVGFTITWFSYLFWDKDNLASFRLLYWIAFIISAFFTFLAYFALKFLFYRYFQKQKLLDMMDDEIDSFDDGATDKTSVILSDLSSNNPKEALLKVTKATSGMQTGKDNDNQNDKEGLFSIKIFLYATLCQQKNVWLFFIPSVINEFQGIFLGAFRPIFVDAFLDDFDKYFRSTYMSVLGQGGIVIEVAILLLAINVGCAYFVRLGIIIRLLTALSGAILLGVLYILDYHEWNMYIGIFMMIFLFMLNIGYIFFLQFFGMIMANLVYEQRANRITNNLIKLSSMTSMYWALHACFAKPLNGIGTIIGTFVLENAGYIGGGDWSDLSDQTQLNVQYALLHLIVWFILGTACIQYFVFRFYDLEGDKLKNVESVIANAEKKKNKQASNDTEYGATIRE